VKFDSATFFGEYSPVFGYSDGTGPTINGRLNVYDCDFGAPFGARCRIVRDFCTAEGLATKKYWFCDGDREYIKTAQKKKEEIDGLVFSNLLSPRGTLSQTSAKTTHLYYPFQTFIDLPILHSGQQVTVRYLVVGKDCPEKFQEVSVYFPYGHFKLRERMHMNRLVRPVKVVEKAPHSPEFVKQILEKTISWLDVQFAFYTGPDQVQEEVELDDLGVTDFVGLLLRDDLKLPLMLSYPGPIYWKSEKFDEKYLTLSYRHALFLNKGNRRGWIENDFLKDYGTDFEVKESDWVDAP
jgi:hypothetical protein